MDTPTKGEDGKPDLELLKPKSSSKKDKESKESVVPQAKEGKSEDVFEVAKILEHLLSPDGFYMKVRWLGYGPDEDSWEPEEDLLECASECVEEYNSSLTAQQHIEIKEFKKALEEEEALKKAKKSAKKSAKKNDAKPKQKPEKLPETPKEVPKKLKRAKYEESDQESDASDKSFENKKAKRSNTKSEKTPQSTRKRGKEEKTSVPTKAALKSYDVPSSAKKAAITHRQNWLDSGSDTDDDDDKNEISFDEEIKAKLLTKKKEETVKKAKPVESTPKTTPKAAPTHVESKKKEDIDNAQETSVVTSSTTTLNTSPKGAKSDWSIDGIVQQTFGTEKQSIILLNNAVTGEKKTATADEAYELAGWKLCKFLIDRCVF